MPESLLISALHSSQAALPSRTADWIELLQQARKCRLLPRLASHLSQQDRWGQVPTKAREQLEAALVVADHHRRTIRWEINRIHAALRGLNCPIILLKGAAYEMLALPMATGRLVSDVDILVPRDILSAVEQSLRDGGWSSLKANDYDEHYYRRWMHELPPLKHADRSTIIDVHHTILPISGRLRPDADKLFEAAQPLKDNSLFTLCPADMVLHAAVHLFQDGEVSGQLRDVSDLDLLVRHFSASDAEFVAQLVNRANELGLSRPLYYTMQVLAELMHTPFPVASIEGLDRRPPSWLSYSIRRLAAQSLRPTLGPAAMRSTIASTTLWARAHCLRMPPWVLVPHLTHKTLHRWFGTK